MTLYNLPVLLTVHSCDEVTAHFSLMPEKDADSIPIEMKMKNNAASEKDIDVEKENADETETDETFLEDALKVVVTFSEKNGSENDAEVKRFGFE